MRMISAPSLAKIAENYGTEPINIIEVRWTDTQSAFYADRDIGDTVKGRVLDIGGLDDVIAVSQGSTSGEVSIVLDDTDGSIKEILNTVDIHKRPCYIYQWFAGIDLDEKFIVFRGQVSSPLTWKEGDRTVSFNVITKVEDREVGFSPEEGEFPSIPKNLIGRCWPSCFGTVLDLKGVPITEAATASLGEGTGIHDFTIPYQIRALQIQDAYLGDLAAYWFTVEAALRGIGETQGADAAGANGESAVQAQIQVRAQIIELTEALEQQESYETTPVRVLGIDEFPQNTLMNLLIGNGIFRGKFIGQFLHITDRQHPEAENFCQYRGLFQGHGTPTGFEPETCRKLPRAVDSGFGPDRIEGEQAGFFWADGGSQIKVYGNEPIDHVISIVPGTVLRVMAFKAVEGTKQLVQVPDSYYTVQTKTYGTISAVMVTLHKGLSLLTGEGWDDGVYVTFQSDVGPNTVDVLEYIINLYLPELSIDSTSFDHVRERLENYPSHFALLEKKNVLQVLKEIAFQARCAIWISGDTFYIRYLPEEPDPVVNVTESDIDTDDGHSTFELFHTATEELVTKYTGRWQESYAYDEPNRVILRHNVNKYGTLERDDHYYIYNIQELVVKSMTFWLIRYANTWKKCRFRTALQTLEAETMDAIGLNFANNYIANVNVKGLIEAATLDTANRTIDYEIWTPVKAGTMVPYDFAWPADVEAEFIFPTNEEVAGGFAGAGAGAPGFGATGQLKTGWVTVNPLRDDNRHDWGDKRPSDLGDVKPSPQFPPINVGPVANNPNLQTPEYIGGVPPEGQMPFYINLRETNVFDPETGQSAKLSSFFRRILGGVLQMNTTATLSDGTQNAQFAFTYDTGSFQFIANLAELKDD